MHYYSHHIGDFIRDTSRLSDAQCMAYLRLMWTYYDTERPIPNTPAKLAFQIGAKTEDVQAILEHFFVHDEAVDNWVHGRCEREITNFRSKSKKASESAKARWENASAMRSHNDRNAEASKSDANQEPRTKNQDSSLRSEEGEGSAGAPPPPPAPPVDPEKPKKAKTPSVLAGKPDDVTDQTWGDWQALRKAKKAPATETVVKTARVEAGKAGLSLEDFLQIWCMRGSQGLQADWLKPDELKGRAKASPHSGFDPSRYGTGTRRI